MFICPRTVTGEVLIEVDLKSIVFCVIYDSIEFCKLQSQSMGKLFLLHFYNNGLKMTAKCSQNM
jgi:hypothetical protein